jgi:hypothetical protein
MPTRAETQGVVFRDPLHVTNLRIARWMGLALAVLVLIAFVVSLLT